MQIDLQMDTNLTARDFTSQIVLGGRTWKVNIRLLVNLGCLECSLSLSLTLMVTHMTMHPTLLIWVDMHARVEAVKMLDLEQTVWHLARIRTIMEISTRQDAGRTQNTTLYL